MQVKLMYRWLRGSDVIPRPSAMLVLMKSAQKGNWRNCPEQFCGPHIEGWMRGNDAKRANTQAWFRRCRNTEERWRMYAGESRRRTGPESRIFSVRWHLHGFRDTRPRNGSARPSCDPGVFPADRYQLRGNRENATANDENSASSKATKGH